MRQISSLYMLATGILCFAIGIATAALIGPDAVVLRDRDCWVTGADGGDVVVVIRPSKVREIKARQAIDPAARVRIHGRG